MKYAKAQAKGVFDGFTSEGKIPALLGYAAFPYDFSLCQTAGLHRLAMTSS